MPTTYNRAGTYKPSQLREEIFSSLAIQPLSVCADGRIVFGNALSSGEETTLYSVMDSHTIDALAEAKLVKIAAIDSRTDQLIANGFTYSGVQFSLSANAQMKMVGTHEVKDDPALVYPLRWNSLDDSDYVDLPDAAALHAFYLTGLGTMRVLVDGGTVLKDAVRAATTIAEVDAVVDNR